MRSLTTFSYDVSQSLLIHGIVFGSLIFAMTMKSQNIRVHREIPIDVILPQKAVVPKPDPRLQVVPKAPVQNEPTPVIKVRQDDKPTQQAVVSQASAVQPNALSLYVGNILELIERQKKFPPAARRKGLQGKVVLRLKLNQKGELIEVNVLDPSPY